MANRNHDVRNPWYVLMTIVGEPANQHDSKTIAANRRYWNGWACSRIEDGNERAALAEKLGLQAKDLEPLSENERARIAEAFRERGDTPFEDDPERGASATREFQQFDKPGFRMPDPTKEISLAGVHFPNAVIFSRCYFPGLTTFDEAEFSAEARFDCSIFEGKVSFSRTEFEMPTSFDNVKFLSLAEFGGSRFEKSVSFMGARFDEAWFVSAIIRGAEFNSTIFKKYVYFERSHFFK